MTERNTVGNPNRDAIIDRNLNVLGDFLKVIGEMIDASDRPDLVVEDAQAAIREVFGSKQPSHSQESIGK